MWQIEPHGAYLKRRSKWPKKYGRELAAMHNNLDTLIAALNGGLNFADATFGFLHSETMGTWAIDQQGGGRHLKASRLYVYPDEPTETMHLITMGEKDKHTQADDIEQCKAFVKEHRDNNTRTDSPSKTTSRETSHVQE